MLTSKSTLMCMITRYPFHKLIEVVAHLQKGIVVFQAIILQLVLFDLLIVSLYRVNKRFCFVCLFGAHSHVLNVVLFVNSEPYIIFATTPKYVAIRLSRTFLQYSSVAKSPKSPNVIMHNTKKPSPATMMPIFLRIV